MGKRYSVRDRERLIEAVRTSGEPVRSVARRMGVKEATAYFWLKRARATKPPEFALAVPAPQATKPTLVVEFGGAAICVERGFDAELLLEVVSTLGRLRS